MNHIDNLNTIPSRWILCMGIISLFFDGINIGYFKGLQKNGSSSFILIFLYDLYFYRSAKQNMEV